MDKSTSFCYIYILHKNMDSSRWITSHNYVSTWMTLYNWTHRGQIFTLQSVQIGGVALVGHHIHLPWLIHGAHKKYVFVLRMPFSFECCQPATGLIVVINALARLQILIECLRSIEKSHFIIIGHCHNFRSSQGGKFGWRQRFCVSIEIDDGFHQFGAIAHSGIENGTVSFARWG